MVRGVPPRLVKCHATIGLLHHPKHGWLLFDTGYAPQMSEATRRWPYFLYRLATPFHTSPQLAISSQIARFGLTPQDIKTIVVSHLHGDHIAGLKDFPNAKFVLTRGAFESVAKLNGIAALKRGLIPELMPSDFQERATLLGKFEGQALDFLGPTHDLFGDGSCVLAALPGHARGQIGILATTNQERCFFIADGCWHRASLRTGRAPHPITYGIVDSVHDVHSTIRNLKRFAQKFPDVVMLPTHCPEMFRERVEQA